MLVAALEYCRREHLGEMVGETGVTASEVGAGMLTDDGLAVDGDEGFGAESIERGAACDDAILPGAVVQVGLAIMENFHDCVLF